jgi:hypothetical protein
MGMNTDHFVVSKPENCNEITLPTGTVPNPAYKGPLRCTWCGMTWDEIEKHPICPRSEGGAAAARNNRADELLRKVIADPELHIYRERSLMREIRAYFESKGELV